MIISAFVNSTILTVASVALLVVFGAMCGYVMQRRPSFWTSVASFLVLAGLIIPPAVVPTIWVLRPLVGRVGIPRGGMMAAEVAMGGAAVARTQGSARRKTSVYPTWFFLPAAVIYGVLFLYPTVASLFFSMTRWTLFEANFIGLDNFVQFFREPFLVKGLTNTLIYAFVTSGLKVVIGLLLGVLLTSNIIGRGYLRAVIFFPVLVSTVGVGITFTVMMHPTQGVINETLALLGLPKPGWLTDPNLALLSVAFVDVWKGVGLATVIYKQRYSPSALIRSTSRPPTRSSRKVLLTKLAGVPTP